MLFIGDIRVLFIGDIKGCLLFMLFIDIRVLFIGDIRLLFIVYW